MLLSFALLSLTGARISPTFSTENLPRAVAVVQNAAQEYDTLMLVALQRGSADSFANGKYGKSNSLQKSLQDCIDDGSKADTECLSMVPDMLQETLRRLRRIHSGYRHGTSFLELLPSLQTAPAGMPGMLDVAANYDEMSSLPARGA